MICMIFVLWTTAAISTGLPVYEQLLKKTFTALMSSDAMLPLQDKDFNVSVSNERGDRNRTYDFHLRNGSLHTTKCASSDEIKGNCDSIENTIICRVSTMGWCASYCGKISHRSLSAAFNVTVTVDEYQTPYSPADISVYIQLPSGTNQQANRPQV
uniref:Putative secreted protein n=1 Tax=Amblyomma americanum TaxID=6943 RepID=A0A0C9R5J9_AMBAM